ncbi:hypothetical protein Bca4012_077048 [Brassica carinata]
MGCRDILLTFSVALLLISLFQIWLFREGQVRELSEDNQVGKDVNTLASKNKKDNVQRSRSALHVENTLRPFPMGVLPIRILNICIMYYIYIYIYIYILYMCK